MHRFARLVEILSRRVPGDVPYAECGIPGSNDHVCRISDAIRRLADDIVGGGPHERAWEQFTLPIRLGGFGVTDPKHMWPSARVMAVVGWWRNGHGVGLPAATCKAQPLD